MAVFSLSFLLLVIQLLPAPSNAQVCASSLGEPCLGTYCSGSHYTGSTCIDGYCRCANNPVRDYCTCLSISGQCRIERGSSSAVGIPTFNGRSQTTYSCVADENCNYDVHIISNYEGDYNHGFGPVTSSGTTNVQLSVSGQGSKPIVLVFVSYEPVHWILSIPTGVIVEKVLIGSFYLDYSDVTYSHGSVLSVERHPRQTLPGGYGSDTGGGRTDRLLEYVVGRFGPVASFSGSYRADAWTLNVQRGEVTGCPNSTDSSLPTPTDVPTVAVTTESDAISGQCHIEQGSSSAVGIPTFNGQSQTTYSCVADANCNYDVHIISNYEGNGHTGFRVHNTGNTDVQLSVSGQGSKPLVLVFVSYEPVNWILDIPSGIIIDKVLLGSYYLERSDVTYSHGSVLSVERHPSQTLPSGYGSDTGGGSTDRLLEYVVGRFGPVASFSGSYRADAWTLNIQRREGCPDSSRPTPTDVPTVTTESDVPPSIVVPPRTSSSSSGIVIGVVLGTTVVVIIILVLLAIIVPVVVIVVSVRKSNAAGGGTTRHLGHLPSPQQQIFYTQQSQPQQTSIHSSATGIRTNVYTGTSVNIQSPAVTRTPNKPVLSKTHTGDLTDSAPPGYDEALNYPAPTAKGSKLPPPYSQ